MASPAWVRDALASELRPHVDVRAEQVRGVSAATVPYQRSRSFSRITPHACSACTRIAITSTASTFIRRVSHETCAQRGPGDRRRRRHGAILEGIFADELAGHRLVRIARSGALPRPSGAASAHRNFVLVGAPPAHTAHFSTALAPKRAMEDVIVCAKRSARRPRHRRRARGVRGPPAGRVEALAAVPAQASLRVFEAPNAIAGEPPASFHPTADDARLRVSHASVANRYPELAAPRRVEESFSPARQAVTAEHRRRHRTAIAIRCSEKSPRAIRCLAAELPHDITAHHPPLRPCWAWVSWSCHWCSSPMTRRGARVMPVLDPCPRRLLCLPGSTSLPFTHCNSVGRCDERYDGSLARVAPLRRGRVSDLKILSIRRGRAATEALPASIASAAPRGLPPGGWIAAAAILESSATLVPR